MLPIGERIRNLRRVKNETQEDLALVLGVTYQAVSRWEKGDAYPDIELLPKLAAHYSVTTDELLGADEETRKEEREKLRQDFLSRVTKDKGSSEHFETMLRASRNFPEEAVFACHALCDLVECRCMSREEGLPFARELSERMVGTSYQQYAVKMMFQYEDSDNLERWKNLSLQDYTTARLYEERYAYLGGNAECSRQRQINLFHDLNRVIWNDFGKKTADGKEDSASWNDGFGLALRLIDCLRDPSTDEDGWIDLRLWIFFRIASNDFYLERTEEGYEALEQAADLLEIIRRYPADHRFAFHTPALDLIYGSVNNDFTGGPETTEYTAGNYFKVIGSLFGTDHGWFLPVKDEPRYQAIAARVRKTVPDDTGKTLILSPVRSPRLLKFGWNRTE